MYKMNFDNFSDKIFSDVRVSAIDFETTGLDPYKGDEICEVGVVVIEEREIKTEYQSLVKITQPMPQEAYRVHKIGDEDLLTAPSLKDVMGEVLEITEGSVYIAHNRDFDLSFFNASLVNVGLREIDRPFLDMLEMSRKLMKGLTNYKLGTIAKTLKLEKVELHRALGDALTTARALIAISDNYNLWNEKVSYLEELSEHPRKTDINPLILKALSKHKRVKIIYESSGGSITERVIRPISLSDDNRLLTSFCYMMDERRYFRLDRIKEVLEVNGE